MSTREIIIEVIGSICFLAFLYVVFMGLYVIAPYEPSPHNEAVYAEAQQ